MKKIVSVFFATLLCCITSYAETLSGKQLAVLNKNIKSYDYVGPFLEGLAMVRKGGKAGFIDKTGKLAIPMKFDASERCVSPTDNFENIFLNGIMGSKELGVIDKQGHVLVPKDSIKEIAFANEGDVMIVTSKTSCYVYERGFLYLTDALYTIGKRIKFLQSMVKLLMNKIWRLWVIHATLWVVFLCHGPTMFLLSTKTENME